MSSSGSWSSSRDCVSYHLPRRLLLDEVTVKVHLPLVKTIGLSSSCICMACTVGYFREFHGCSIRWYPLRIPGSHDPDLSALQLFTSRSTAALQASGSLSYSSHPEIPVGFISWISEPWTVVDVFWFRTQITEPWKLIWGSKSRAMRISSPLYILNFQVNPSDL